MAKKEQKRGKCIFCDSGDLSKEHIWADWMRQVFPRSDHSTRHAVTSPNGRRHGKLHRPGDVRSQRLRVVCSECNNGWMSRIQSKAKPAILSILNEGKFLSSAADREALAAWAVLFTLVYEQAEPSLINSTQEERRAFKESNGPPYGWTVYLCRTNLSKDRVTAWRRAGHMEVSGLRVQVTLINFETWAILTLTGPNSPHELVLHAGLSMIWPSVLNIMGFFEVVDGQVLEALVPSILPSDGYADMDIADFIDRFW